MIDRAARLLLGGAVLAFGCHGELVPGTGNDTDRPRAEAVDAGESASSVFRPRVQEELTSAGCLLAACHAHPAVPMVLTVDPETEAAWSGNYEEVVARVGTLGSSLFIDKALGAGGHVAMSETDPRLDHWREWIALGAPYVAEDPEDEAR